MTDERKQAVRFGAAFAAAFTTLTCLLFNRIVFAGEWLSARDTLRVYYPLAKYWADRVSAGEFPEWYPYNALGQPFVGMVVSAAFHPLRLLYLVLPLQTAHSVHTLVCYPAAAIGTFLCARALGLHRAAAVFAAATYAFSGYLVGISNNLAYLVAAATFPFALWTAARLFEKATAARLCAASCVLTLVLLSGEVQTFALTMAAVVLLAVVYPGALTARARAARAVGAVGVALLLGLPQLLPALGALAEARANVNPLSTALTFSVHPLRLVELPLGPVFIGHDVGLVAADASAVFDPKTRSTWVDSISVGALAFFLALFGATQAIRGGRMPRAMSALAALVALLMVGRHLPVFEWFFRFVPLWKAFRYPEKLVPFFLFLLALSAGAAVHRVHEDAKVRTRSATALAIAAGVLLAVVASQWALGSWHAALSSLGMPERTATPLAAQFIRLTLAAAILLLGAALVLWRARPGVSAWTFAIVQAGFIVWLHLPLPQTVSLPLLDEPIGFVEMLRERGASAPDGPRVQSLAGHTKLPKGTGLHPTELIAAGIVASLEAEVEVLFGMSTSDYYLPASSDRLLRGYTNPAWPGRLAPLFGTRFQTNESRRRQPLEATGVVTVLAELTDWQLILAEDHSALARTYLAEPVCVGDSHAALRTLTVSRGEFRPGIHAVLECSEPTDWTSAGDVGTAKITQYRPESVTVRVNAKRPAVAVLNDAHYSGWSADIDGKPARVEPANFAVRGVRVPEGEHVVTFTYRQPGLRTGAVIAAFTLLALLIGVAVDRRKRRTRSDEQVTIIGRGG